MPNFLIYLIYRQWIDHTSTIQTNNPSVLPSIQLTPINTNNLTIQQHIQQQQQQQHLILQHQQQQQLHQIVKDKAFQLVGLKQEPILQLNSNSNVVMSLLNNAINNNNTNGSNNDHSSFQMNSFHNNSGITQNSNNQTGANNNTSAMNPSRSININCSNDGNNNVRNWILNVI